MKIRAEDEIKILKNKLDVARNERDMALGETSIVKGIGMNSPEMKEAKAKIEALDKQKEILKTAIRKAVGQIHTLKYENDVLNRKIKIAEDWVGQLREVGL
tara:strand:+ start:466 stop:768 length:303 start_codon:yes stop_codon:yes gene_type:complete